MPTETEIDYTEFSLAEFLEFVLPALSIAYNLAFLVDGLYILRNKSVGRQSITTYYSLMMCFLVRFIYGYIVDDGLTMMCSAFGVIVGAFTTCVFQIYSKKSHVYVYVVGTCMAFTVFYFAIVGYLSVADFISSLVMTLVLGFPWSAAASVFVEQSTSPICLLKSVINWCYAVTWFSYAVILHPTASTYIPNLISLFLATAQLALFVVYGYIHQSKKPSRITFHAPTP
mmetsp:Transcript_21487/g.31187  ORF Transcript_21487/g.31187 Transcript_21487/m.31187 type:complete len:228 (-) Transcript_21487:296-979(-)